MKKKWVHIKNGYKSYIIHICKPDLALNNPQWLMCRETQTTKPNQIQTASSRIWTRVTKFISYDKNCYTKSAFMMSCVTRSLTITIQ